MSYDPIRIAEEFFESVRRVRALGAGTPETAYYPALHTLFERVGSSLSPKVLALSQLANTGAGSPDFGLFAASQVQKGEPRKGQMPERGVVEVKPVADDSLFKSTPAQLTKYYDAYGLVLVTNLRAFQLVGPDVNGTATRLEAFAVAETATDFWSLIQTPEKSAKAIGLAFVEYLRRALAQNVALVQPKDVAWFLASYARDALARVDAAGDLPALKTVRTALEDALGITFDEEKGDHFFRSTLVQTLFYGLFSAWVIWARATPRMPPRFDWRSAGWSLHVPFVQTLFQQLTSPQHIKQLDLVEVLDWTGNTLNRIDAAEFLKRFDQGEAVQYFYEPFLEAFDPKLRKQFGVWYTPAEIVDYMVARVDRALKDELDIADGLADERVYVLDPCCGTGGFVNAVLRRIRANLENHGLGDALADRMRDAAQKRVFGFEIMPAPFVVAHSLSCPGMRERYLETFDSIAIDCLNGDKYKTGKKTPEGLPDPSIFSTPANREGIKVGTAIATLVRKKDHKPSKTVAFRHLWGTAKRETLAATAEAEPTTLYEHLTPSLPLRLQFMPADVGAGYFEWPRLPELLPVSFAGVKTSRDEFLIDVDRGALEKRIEQYFDLKVSNADLTKAYPALMNSSSRYDPAETRKSLIGRKHALGSLVRYAYRPSDVRWAYWDPDTKLLDEKRPEFFGNAGFENRFLTAGERNRMGVFYKPQSISVLGDHHLVESNVAIFPATVRQDSQNLEPNVAKSLKKELGDRGISSRQLFDHILASLNAPTYEISYIDALRIDWPRIPFPGELEVFASSAELGAILSALLDAEIDVDGVRHGIAPCRGWTASPAKLLARSDGDGPECASLNFENGWASGSGREIRSRRRRRTIAFAGACVRSVA